MIPADVRLFTWVDVEEVLFRAQQKGEWPAPLVWARAYWDNLTLGIRPGFQATVKAWLSQQFDPRFDPDHTVIILESVNGVSRTLRIWFEETEEPATPPVFKPSLARPTTVVQSYQQTSPPALDPACPPVIAFHSFKGGVGRTLFALALALAVREKDRDTRVLLIDSDLEAPGLSWLLRDRFPAWPIAMADFLALVHGDPDPKAQDSITLVADRIRDLLMDGIYILPSFRSIGQFSSLEIKPEHLIQNAKNPYVLTELLAELGRTLKVSAVIVDLRAGLSELSTGILLDPRVYRVLVTTLSDQALTGTCEVLKILGQWAPAKQPDHPLPTLIMTQTPPEFVSQRQLLEPYEKRLLEATQFFLEQSGVENDTPYMITSEFDSKLTVLPDSWNRVTELLVKQGMVEQAANLLDWLPQTQSKRPSVSILLPSELTRGRENLAEFAHQMVFAERGDVREYLAIPPLRRLAVDFSKKVPIAIIVGAKGAGKTFTFLQFIRFKSWEAFTADAIERPSEITAPTYPVCQPKNLESRITEEARREIQQALGLTASGDYTKISDYLRDGIRDDLHEGGWRERWLDIVAWSAGFEFAQAGAGRRLAEHLRAESQFCVAIFDGLEDIFQELPSDPKQQKALRALLQDVPEWLEQQPGRPMGLLVFVRQDMVLNAIKQNSAQFLSRYEPYALEWDAEEALRLVLWMSQRSRLPIQIDNLQDLKVSELVEALIPLWGRKLGSPDSREGRSAAWIVAALSDLQGQIQARDIVRFLEYAAQGSINDTRWMDRILIPAAIRDAVEKCGGEKIKEIQQENPKLGDILTKLASLDDEHKQAPFAQSQVGLSAEDLTYLSDTGVVLGEREEYYMAEIFRRGLDFKLKAGARPRVLSLSRKLLGKILM